MPSADCGAGTNELIGEDLSVIISLECQPVNGIRLVELHGDLMLHPPLNSIVNTPLGIVCCLVVRVCCDS